MLLRITQFELRYRSKRPATYLYFFVMFIVCFFAVVWEQLSIGGATGQVKEDAAAVIMNQSVTMSLIGLFISSAIMGVSILRDFEHKTSAMMFTAPIKKRDYLFGRFLGSFIVLALVLTSIPLGLMLGRLTCELLPPPAGDMERFLPVFHPEFYWQPYFMFILPNAFISGAIFFLSGALSKRLLFVFLQGIGLFSLYLMTRQMVGRLEDRELAALLDPFGLRLSTVISQYWSIAEQNYQMIPWDGLVIQNRLLWIGIGIICMILTYFLFTFTTPSKKQKKKKTSTDGYSSDGVEIPTGMSLAFDGFQIQYQRISALVKLYYREIVLSIPFIGIALFGFIMLAVNSRSMGEVFGTPTFPTTYLILELLTGYFLFFFIIIIFYSGELIWRERDLKVHQIYDTLPIPDAVGLVSKFLAFVLVHATLLLCLIVLGITIQASKGYYNFELGIYFTELFTNTFISLILFTLLTFFVQVIVNNKFLGHGLMILIFIVNIILAEVGVEHTLLRFDSGDLDGYSDMNLYGDSFFKFSWLKAYWFGFTMLLFGLAVAFSVRGTDTIMKTRAKLAGMRFVRPLLIFTIAAVLLFAGTGIYIYYNTTVVNEFAKSDTQEKDQANYEKELKQYQFLNQPKIVENNLHVDIFPKERDYAVEGEYILKNKSKEPISVLHIQSSVDEDLTFEPFEFEMLDSLKQEGEEFKLAQNFERFSYLIYELPRPLMPGDSLRMLFSGKFDTKGFKNGGTNTAVVHNGTFFNNFNFPSIGYNPSFELGSDDDRRKNDLPKKQRQMERTDPQGIMLQDFISDADWIRFDVTMSTSNDQIAIAPGYLQKSWNEGDRRYFHYKMDRPILKFYSMISARYEVMRDYWVRPNGDSVSLEIYYHKGHEYNLDRMMDGMKHSLAYFSEIFSPFQYRQMRIMEFPRYSSFAQSFANTVPFSEGIGFIVDVDDEKDVDIPYYVTSHEVAHQWWAHQVIPANTKGGTMIVESLAQYSALMLMNKHYGPEKMRDFLKEELDRYLGGRSFERKKEMPLVEVENQQYIHYGKGAVIFYALQDYITEDSLNKALRKFIDEWAYAEGPYPTTLNLMEYIYDVTPDSLTSIVKDMFERITFYENKMLKAEMVEQSGQFKVDMTLNTVKMLADSLGNEQPIDLKEWMYVGLYGNGQKGKDSLIYMQKHYFDSDTTQLSISLDSKPTKAIIDPISILIDKHPKDNSKTISVVD
ncbi:MAG: aminopeptidase [Bacteroidia bacterium]|nr:aminopeptidase [Bacteroidia bacterium]